MTTRYSYDRTKLAADSAFDYIIDQGALGDLAYRIREEDMESYRLLRNVMRKLEKELTLSTGAHQALARVKDIVERGKNWDIALLRNNIFKAAHALGMDLPSGMFSASTHKTAGFEGPAGRILQERWNDLHDLERDLKEVLHKYDAATTYKGGPGERAAEAMVRQVQAVIDAIQKMADDGGHFDDLLKAENAFMKQYGDPDNYVVEQRNRMFPR